MRHTFALLALGIVLGLAGWTVDAVAARSPAPGVILAWTNDPGRLLATLPAGHARVVDVWLSGRLVQLHVDAMRQFDSRLLAASAAIRLPAAAVVLAACG